MTGLLRDRKTRVTSQAVKEVLPRPYSANPTPLTVVNRLAQIIVKEDANRAKVRTHAFPAVSAGLLRRLHSSALSTFHLLHSLPVQLVSALGVCLAFPLLGVVAEAAGVELLAAGRQYVAASLVVRAGHHYCYSAGFRYCDRGTFKPFSAFSVNQSVYAYILLVVSRTAAITKVHKTLNLDTYWLDEDGGMRTERVVMKAKRVS